MTKRLVAIAFFSILLGAAVAGTAMADGDEVTVRGEILDLACYIGHGATGEEHAPCAVKCVKGGQPMGLLSADGKVYLLVANHNDAAAFEQAKELAGKQVELQGTSMSRDGIQAVEVRSVKKL
jgi:hypothetical protein